jgi:flagellar motility protein MotE (MotC chaperone)
VGAIVDTYGQLEPDAAAGILQAMQDTDPDTLLTVASALQAASARRFAAVMAEMDPAFAASLTSRLRARAAPEPSAIEMEARNAAAGER